MEKFQKHYLITGGAGFIGSHVVKALLKDESIKITSLDNFESQDKKTYKVRKVYQGEQAKPELDITV